MVELECGQDLGALGIQTKEGVNITAFLDHLNKCDRCREARGTPIYDLNAVIGSEVEDRGRPTPRRYDAKQAKLEFHA